MGWDALVEDLRVVDITGDHEHIFYEPYTTELARKFQAALNEMDEGALVK